MLFPGNGHVPLIVDKPLVCGRGLPGRLSSHCSSIQHGRPTPSHRPALTLARCSAPADFASLRVLGAPAASRPPLLTSSLVALPASLGSSYRPALRWPGIPGLRSASRCPRPFTPSGFDGNGLFRAQRAAFVRPAVGGPVFRRCAPPSPSAARCSGVADALWACPRASSRFAAFDCALRVLAPPAASRPPTASDRDGNAFLRFAPTLNSAWSFHCARKLACGSPCFIGLTTACFRHWRRPSCAPALRLRGVPCLRTSCARHFSPSGLHLFASICSAKNARNDVHPTIRNGRPAAPEGLQYSLVHWAYYGLFRALRAAFVRPVISDESLALPILCQCSVTHALPWEWACAYMSAPDEGHIRA